MNTPFKALLVEDNPADVVLLRDALIHHTTKPDLVVEVEGSLGEAVERLRGEPFDVVLLDLGLPDSDGTSTLTDLLPRSKGTPVVVLTGIADDALGLQLIQKGAQDYLVKGRATGEAIVRSIRYAVERGRGERQIRELNQELQARTNELLEAQRRKDEFLAVLGHELRNPLAPIRHAASAMRLKGLPPDLEPLRGMIDRQVDQLTRLVDDLLDLSRITQGHLPLRLAPVDLADVIHRAIEEVRPEASSQDLRIEERCEASLQVTGDAARLVQVLGNLLSNAIRHSSRGGRIQVSSEREGALAIVRVADEGEGIEPELLEQIFELFVHGSPTRHARHGALGVGLALSRILVEKHAGTISAFSEGAGKGSEFVVRLPARSAGASATSTEPDPVVPAASCRILVVDDNADAADSLALLLELDGHDVCVARSGAEAVDTAKRFTPEVVLLDIGLPDLDGYEVARVLRGLPNGEALHLVALTGYGRPEDRERAMNAGFDQHLVKPIDTHTLRAVLAAS